VRNRLKTSVLTLFGILSYERGRILWLNTLRTQK
jgi:hypothetical protein